MTEISLASLRGRVGEVLGQSEWFEIDQARVNAFADVTLDHQFIHVDPERAAQTPLGGPVVHGYLTLSLLPHLMQQVGFVPTDATLALNYGLDRVRFLTPVSVGSRVRAVAKLTECSDKAPGQVLLKVEATVEIEGVEKPALVAQTLSLVFVDG